MAQADARGHEVFGVGRDPGVQSAVTLAAGHDVAISSVYDSSADHAAFYGSAARALVASGVPRIIVVGISPLLAGLEHLDSVPDEHHAVCLAHHAGVSVLSSSSANWLVMSPDTLSYEDFALAVLDEVERPTSSRTQIGIRSASA